MSVWFSALMGLVQGLTEFLPVSSSGHLVLLQSISGLDFSGNGLCFDVLLHAGTLVSVLICFRRDIAAMLREAFRMLRDILHRKPLLNDNPDRRLLILIFISSLPMLLVPLISDSVEKLFSDPIIVGAMLIVTALLLYIADHSQNRGVDAASASWKDALTVGCFQLAALIPGISRSGATVTGGSIRGFRRDFAVRYSFLMSIPVIIGANIFTLRDAFSEGITPDMTLPYLTGIVCAAISGIAAIKLVRYIARRQNFRVFSVYTAVVGIAAIVISVVGRL